MIRTGRSNGRGLGSVPRSLLFHFGWCELMLAPRLPHTMQTNLGSRSERRFCGSPFRRECIDTTGATLHQLSDADLSVKTIQLPPDLRLAFKISTSANNHLHRVSRKVNRTSVQSVFIIFPS